MKNLRSVDLNLMTVFEAVYENGSQVAAARQLGMTQSAVSTALGRLRLVVKDPLFEAKPSGLQPTPRAHSLYQHVHQALMVLRAGMVDPGSFDPASSQRTFTATMGYGGGMLWGLPLFERMRKEAPGVRLAIRGVDPFEEIPRLLANQSLDLALHHERFEDVMLDQTLLARTELVVIARPDHPRIHEQSTLDELLAEEFAAVSQFDLEPATVEFREFMQAYRQRVMLEVPNALMLPLMVHSSNMLALTSRRMATCYGERCALQVLPLPVPGAMAEAFIIWHRSMEVDPAHVWLRAQFAAMIPNVKQAAPIY